MSTLLSDDTLHNLVSTLYEGVLKPARWDVSARQLAEVFSVPAVHFLFWDKRENCLLFDTVAAGRTGTREEVIAAAADYSAGWGQFDYRLAYSARLTVGTWFQCHEVFRERDVRSEPFFNDYIKRWRFRWLAGFHVLSRDDFSAHLGLLRRFSEAPLVKNEMKALARIGRHLSSAAQMFVDAEDLRQTARLGLDALHAWAVPALLLDPTARVRFANRAAERLLEGRNAFVLACTRLTIRDASLQREFSRALDAAIRNGEGQSVAIPRAVGQPIIATFYPLPRNDHPYALTYPRSVLLTIVEPTKIPHSHLKILRQVFGLTHREAELTLALCEDQSPAEFAQRAGVSINTVRSQIRSIYMKCGLSRQRELARLVASIPHCGASLKR